jgi:3'-phosphoadenosine 5'-phosphosulfate sulfotransferase (PAPS reductase)/FAD synthetase
MAVQPHAWPCGDHDDPIACLEGAAENALNAALADLDFEASFSGQKSSEGDGRTAADIERERASGAE